MRAAAAEPAALEHEEERSALREGDDEDRKPKDAAGALGGGLRALVEAEAVEKVVGAAAAMVCGFSSA